MADIDRVAMGGGTYEKVLTLDRWPCSATPVIVIGSRLERGADDQIIAAHTLDEVLRLLDER